MRVFTLLIALTLSSSIFGQSQGPPLAETPPEVMIRATHIRFNHDLADPTSTRDGLNIRIDEGTDLDHNQDLKGEWIEERPPWAVHQDDDRSEPALHKVSSNITVFVRFEAATNPLSTGVPIPFPEDFTTMIAADTSYGQLPDFAPVAVKFSGGVSDPEYVKFTMNSSLLPGMAFGEHERINFYFWFGPIRN